MRTYLVTPMALLCLLTSARAADPEPRTISTNGEATVYVSPDQVIVTFGIETFNGKLEAATEANKQAAASLVKAIKAIGIEDQYIQTDILEVTIKYDRMQENQTQIVGYFARRSYSVKLKDTKLFESLIETGFKNGANQLHGVDFQTTELRKYRDQARQLAIKAAREKAVLLAKELGCSVGKPRNISESGGGYSFGRSSRGTQYGNFGQNAIQSTPAIPDASDTLPLGQIAVQAAVSVAFDLTE